MDPHGARKTFTPIDRTRQEQTQARIPVWLWEGGEMSERNSCQSGTESIPRDSFSCWKWESQITEYELFKEGQSKDIQGNTGRLWWLRTRQHGSQWRRHSQEVENTKGRHHHSLSACLTPSALHLVNHTRLPKQSFFCGVESFLFAAAQCSLCLDDARHSVCCGAFLSTRSRT